MQLFDAIENCFPAMEKQYQEICPPPEDFWPPGTDGARAAGGNGGLDADAPAHPPA